MTPKELKDLKKLIRDASKFVTGKYNPRIIEEQNLRLRLEIAIYWLQTIKPSIHEHKR